MSTLEDLVRGGAGFGYLWPLLMDYVARAIEQEMKMCESCPDHHRDTFTFCAMIVRDTPIPITDGPPDGDVTR